MKEILKTIKIFTILVGFGGAISYTVKANLLDQPTPMNRKCPHTIPSCHHHRPIQSPLGNESLGYKLQPILKQKSTAQLVALANDQNVQRMPFQLINVAMRILANDIGMQKDIYKDYGLNQGFFIGLIRALRMHSHEIDHTSRALISSIFE